MYMGTAPEGDHERLRIKQFQAGDTRAGDALFRAHKGSLIKACSDYRRQYPWLDWDELWSAAQFAFFEAIHDFNLSRNNGLNAYVRPKVKYALQGVLEDGLRNGATGEGRAGNAEFRSPNKFRITYRHTDSLGPTDEWRRIETQEQANTIAVTARRTFPVPENASVRCRKPSPKREYAQCRKPSLQGKVRKPSLLLYLGQGCPLRPGSPLPPLSPLSSLRS
jgi:hypothetical protein